MKKKDEASRGLNENVILPNTEKSEVEDQSEKDRFLGAELARVLLDELNSQELPEPPPRYKELWIGKLEKDIPERGGTIGFQIIEGEAAPKWFFSKDIASEPTKKGCKRLFCMTHHEFVPSGCMASDHVFPHTKIRQNQKRLLDFLNAKENAEITNSFLEYRNINEYLRRDNDDKVKGSTYFYRMSYNILGNLVLMCQGCNSSKKECDPYEWYMEEIREENSYFGDPFRRHVESLGGLHDGILLPRVYREEHTGLPVQLSPQTTIILPPEGILTKEFGTVILKWYSDHYKGIFNIHRRFYVDNFVRLKKYIEKLAPLLVSNDEREHKLAIKKEIKLKKKMGLLAEIQKEVFLPGFSDMKSINIGESSSSSSDNPEVDASSTKYVTASVKSAMQANHAVHKMFRTVRAFYDNDFAKSILSYINVLRSEKDPLFGENWYNISERFSDYIAHLPSGPKEINDQLKNDFQNEIKRLYLEERKTLGSVDVRDYAELEEQKAELETALKQQKEESEAALKRQKEEFEAALKQQKEEFEAALKQALEAERASEKNVNSPRSTPESGSSKEVSGSSEEESMPKSKSSKEESSRELGPSLEQPPPITFSPESKKLSEKGKRERERDNTTFSLDPPEQKRARTERSSPS